MIRLLVQKDAAQVVPGDYLMAMDFDGVRDHAVAVVVAIQIDLKGVTISCSRHWEPVGKPVTFLLRMNDKVTVLQGAE